MVNFRELFTGWSFTKDESQSLFKSEAEKLKYVDGELYWETIGESSYNDGLLTTSVLSYDNGRGKYDSDYLEYIGGRLLFS